MQRVFALCMTSQEVSHTSGFDANKNILLKIISLCIKKNKLNLCSVNKELFVNGLCFSLPKIKPAKSTDNIFDKGLYDE